MAAFTKEGLRLAPPMWPPPAVEVNEETIVAVEGQRMEYAGG